MPITASSRMPLRSWVTRLSLSSSRYPIMLVYVNTKYRVPKKFGASRVWLPRESCPIVHAHMGRKHRRAFARHLGRAAHGYFAQARKRRQKPDVGVGDACASIEL